MSITNAQDLKNAIARLEAKSKVQEEELKEQFHVTIESLKPGNMIKSAISQIPASAVIGNVLKTAGTLGVGILTSRIAGAGAAAGAGRNILGSVLSETAKRTFANNIDKIKAYGTAVVHNLINKKEPK
jgi:hypothetical protein